MQLANYLEGSPLLWMMLLHLHFNLTDDYYENDDEDEDDDDGDDDDKVRDD